MCDEAESDVEKMSDRRAAASPGGLVLVDKERGPSSFAVVRRIRNRLGLKAGHAGTLDPFATGLLLCLVGRATRLARYLVGLDKRYATEIRLGVRTTTGDAEGGELETTGIPSRDEIVALHGDVDLRVPAASAVKIGGERAYALHRRGVSVEMPVRRSTVHELEVVRFEPPDLELALRVSSGTYVRALADALGGHCRSLRRTAVGPFRVEEADEARVLPPLAAVRFLPRRELSSDEARRVRAGQALDDGDDGDDGDDDGLVALTHEDALLAVGRRWSGRIRGETVL